MTDQLNDNNDNLNDHQDSQNINHINTHTCIPTYDETETCYKNVTT